MRMLMRVTGEAGGWRTSSWCEGGACVEAGLRDARWRKSTRSGSDGGCVETAGPLRAGTHVHGGRVGGVHRPSQGLTNVPSDGTVTTRPRSRSTPTALRTVPSATPYSSRSACSPGSLAVSSPALIRASRCAATCT